MALRYIEAGIVIVKTHAPIFSESGRVGCTCEAYKRSDKYRQWCEEHGKNFDPNYTCLNPGKHPVGGWKNEAAGVTADNVHDTWGRFYTVTDVDTGKRVQVVYNIGALTGPSNLVALDADTYKEFYQCALSDLVDLDDQETPTANTHSGGTHLLFDRQGKPYSNANGELKAAGIEGVDIRGEGGFLVLAPSVGPSRNQYSWAEGYEPWTVKPRPIPPALDAILASAAGKRSKATAKITFTAPTTERPNLSQWRVSKDILDLIHSPRPKGQRSEGDYSVCLSLCYAGASDDDILSVFEHFPIGTGGKFAEAGRPYLALTIANARTYAAEHPRPDVGAIIAHYRNLVVSADWSQIVPIDRQSAAGYKTGDTDRKLFDNLLDICQRAGRAEGVTVSYRQLITATNADGVQVAIASLTTAKKFLDRVNGVLLTYAPSDRGTIITLAPVVVRSDTSNQMVSSCSEVSDLTTTAIYTSHKGDDAFARGVAKEARKRIQQNKQRLCAENEAFAAAAKAYRKALRASKPSSAGEWRAVIGGDYDLYRELIVQASAEFLPGLGTYGLLVIADLLDNPGGTRQEIADRRGLTKWAVANVLRKLETWELVEVDQAETFGARKCYTLVGDVFGEIDAKLPEAKTHNIGVQRLDRCLQAGQMWAQKTADRAATEEDRRLAEKRANRYAQQRFAAVKLLHPDWTDEQAREHIYAQGARHRPWIDRKIELREAAQRLAERQAETAAMQGTIDDLRRQGRKGAAAYSDALFAGWTPAEAAKIAAIASGKAVRV